jgi:hypothetical protein
MTESDVRSDQPPKLLARGAIKNRLALASGLVLTVGAWLAPQAAQTGLHRNRTVTWPTVFLKTIIPSRKAMKQYLGEESDDEDGR